MSRTPQPVTGPFFPVRRGKTILMVCLQETDSRICHKQKRKMQRSASKRAVRIIFCRERRPEGLVVAVLSDALTPGAKPKKDRQDPFERRANDVMSLAGTAHDTPDKAAVALAT